MVNVWRVVDQLDGTVLLELDAAQYCVMLEICLPFVTVNVVVDESA